MLAGRPFLALAEGGLFEPETSALIVADLHLEKGTAFARRGSLVPPYDSRATLRLLQAMIDRLAPRRVICLGDSFHDDGGAARLEGDDLAHLARLQSGRDWLWVAGNHDRLPPRGVGGEWTCETMLHDLALRHEPCAGIKVVEIAGHLHPAALIRGRGRVLRCRCIASDGWRAILPALGAYAGGLDLSHRAFDGLFLEDQLTAYVLEDQTVYPVALRRRPRSARP